MKNALEGLVNAAAPIEKKLQSSLKGAAGMSGVGLVHDAISMEEAQALMHALANAEFMRDLLVDHRCMQGHVPFDEEVFVTAVEVIPNLAKRLNATFIDDVDDGVILVV